MQYASRLLLIDTSPNVNLLTDEAINQLYNIADIVSTRLTVRASGCASWSTSIRVPPGCHGQWQLPHNLSDSVARFVDPLIAPIFRGRCLLGCGRRSLPPSTFRGQWRTRSRTYPSSRLPPRRSPSRAGRRYAMASRGHSQSDRRRSGIHCNCPGPIIMPIRRRR